MLLVYLFESGGGVFHLRGSEPRRLSCEAARGPPTWPQPPARPPPACDLSEASRKGCAPPP